ncbi:SIS domain-containing protein [bacterium]|nr:SIS domain-containing protein [bacterium]
MNRQEFKSKGSDQLIVGAVEKLHRAVQDAATMHSQLSMHCFADLTAIAEASATSLRNGGRLFFCGNGGSAAECQHLATEFVVRLSSHRERQALAAIALTTDTSLLTACSNDYGFDNVFARQLEALARAGDVVFLLSTSGRSQNLIGAAQVCAGIGAKVVGFLGSASTPLDKYLDFALRIPSTSGQRVQEAHLLCGHMMVELIEDLLLYDGDETTRPAR